MASGSSGQAQQSLNVVIDSVLSLLQQLQPVLAAIGNASDELLKETAVPNDAATKSINPTTVTHDAASLVRAHSTKLSLLIINEPFTPSAIIKVLRELASGPIPAIAAAAQTCDAKEYTADFRKALAWKSHSVLKELAELVSQIPKDGKVLSKDQKTGSGRGSMATTGLVWEACDNAMQFCRGGVRGYFTKRVEDISDTLKDTMEELKDWGEETEDSDADDFDDDEGADIDSGIDVTDSLESSQTSVQAMLDDLMNSHRAIPHDDPDGIRPRLETCLRRLRLSTLLCQAVIRRRIKKLPDNIAEHAGAARKLEEAYTELKGLPARYEDLAMAFYDLQAAGIDAGMRACVDEAIRASKILRTGWDGAEDEYTQWIGRFEQEMNK